MLFSVVGIEAIHKSKSDNIKIDKKKAQEGIKNVVRFVTKIKTLEGILIGLRCGLKKAEHFFISREKKNEAIKKCANFLVALKNR